MSVKKVIETVLAALIIGNVVWFFTVEQAAGYQVFYPDLPWRAYHLALSVELTEIALATVLGAKRLGWGAVPVGAVLGVLFCCSVFFSGLYQLNQVQQVKSQRQDFQRQRELLAQRFELEKSELAYFKKTGQKGNYARTSRAVGRTLEAQRALKKPSQSAGALDVEIWAIFALRFAVKLAGLILAGGLGRVFAAGPLKSAAEPADRRGPKIDGGNPSSPLNVTGGPVRGGDGRFVKRG